MNWHVPGGREASALVFIQEFIAANGGVATHAQLLTVTSRKAIAKQVQTGALVRVFQGVYALEHPDTATRLAALDALVQKPVVACMGTAASLYGFDTEDDGKLHILDPGMRMRPKPGLVVHQRIGAPLRRIEGRLATAPGWTAVEAARALRRPRAMATLDAVLRSGACTREDIENAILEQKGRRGIVKVRTLLPYADPRSESAMESETRLVFLEFGLQPEELQYEVTDWLGQLWRLDFAWPTVRFAVEYDSTEWHANPQAWRRDRLKNARLKECGWKVLRIVADDVRRHPENLAAQVAAHLRAARLAG